MRVWYAKEHFLGPQPPGLDARRQLRGPLRLFGVSIFQIEHDKGS